MKIIAIIGMPGSGKDVAVQLLKKELDLDYIRMGDVVIEETKKRNLNISDENVGQVANSLREEHGMNAIAKLCIDKIRKSQQKCVIINGVRGIEEIKYFRTHLKDLIIVGIHSAPRIRFERLVKRNREDDIKNEDEFNKRDERELKWGIADAFILADEIICNQGTINELKGQLTVLLRKYNI